MNSFVERGTFKPEQVKVVWKSEPLPNDPLVVRADLEPALVQRLQEVVLAITEQQALTLMPKNYTGWVVGDHSSYKLIQDAGVAVGRLQPRTATK